MPITLSPQTLAGMTQTKPVQTQPNTGLFGKLFSNQTKTSTPSTMGAVANSPQNNLSATNNTLTPGQTASTGNTGVAQSVPGSPTSFTYNGKTYNDAPTTSTTNTGLSGNVQNNTGNNTNTNSGTNTSGGGSNANNTGNSGAYTNVGSADPSQQFLSPGVKNPYYNPNVTNVASLTNMGQGANTDNINQINAKIAALQTGGNNAINNLSAAGAPINYDLGQVGAINTVTAANVLAQEGALGNALTERNQNITAATNGATASTPTALPLGSVLTGTQTGNPVNGQTFQQNAINQGTLAGQQQAAQTNAATAGTEAQSAGAQAYIAQYPAVKQLNQALNNVTSLGNMTVQNAQGNNINPFSAAPANATLAQIKAGLSDSGQVTFNSNMAQLQAAIQSLYSQGGGQTPSNIVSQINQIADGSLSVSGLQSLLTAAQSEGQLLLTNASNTALSEYNQGQGNSGSTGSSSTFGGSAWQ